ncbi:TonB-dependent siderophore receptor [Hydrogenovibrio sp. JE_KL2]|uniref:TonB-dependent receptor plug domain-containing protein n=1 Tax=Hydrogenovibrio sp. JE_KL2 TaxID=2651188 RepID=UPI00128DB336|nr:TonB-dependent receptor [Hydrogenovibrio sp. JE_KL2]MPQ75811.1 TonB-dependent receptor [Hydrogenovibrio sp. JE_KL2]
MNPNKMRLAKTPIALAIFSICSASFAADDQNLNSVVVTANNTPQNIGSVTSNVTVITAEDIANHQYQTLQDAMRQVPGLTTYSNGGLGTATSLFMRGMGGKNILVLQNGMQLNDPTLTDGTTNFANIMLDDVERIEIIKGPQSGVWGANASAGVINIITKKGGKRANANLEFGSNNQKKLAASLGAGNEKVDFALNFSDLSSDGFTSIKKYKTSGKGDEKDPFAQQEASFRLGINFEKQQRLETFIKHSSGDSESDYSTPNTASHSTFESTLRQLRYLATFGKVDTQLYAQDSHIRREYPAYSSVYEGKVNQFGAQADWHYADKQQASFAVASKQLEDIKNKNSYYNRSAAANNTNQLFGEKWVITEAVRYDEYNRFDNKTTGKIGTKYHVIPEVFISANYGTGYNAPSLYQLTNLSTQTTQLTPETSTGYDATLGVYGLELTYFNNEIKDELVTDASYKYYNQKGTSKYEGIEANYKRTLDAIDSDLTLNFTQQTAKDKDGKWLARRPEQQGGLGFDYYGLARTHVGIQTKYVGNLYDKADKKGANIGNYSTTDLVADYQFNPHVSIYGKVQNLFNEDYTPAVASYESDGVTPKYVYNNGGTLLFVGVRGKL